MRGSDKACFDNSQCWLRFGAYTSRTQRKEDVLNQYDECFPFLGHSSTTIIMLSSPWLPFFRPQSVFLTSGLLLFFRIWCLCIFSVTLQNSLSLHPHVLYVMIGITTALCVSCMSRGPMGRQEHTGIAIGVSRHGQRWRETNR